MPFPFSERLGAAPPRWQPQTGSPTAQAFWAPWKAPSQSLQATEGLPTRPRPRHPQKVKGHREPRGHPWSSGEETDALSL